MPPGRRRMMVMLPAFLNPPRCLPRLSSTILCAGCFCFYGNQVLSSLSVFSALACPSAVTVTSYSPTVLSPTPFVSHRGIFNANQSLLRKAPKGVSKHYYDNHHESSRETLRPKDFCTLFTGYCHLAKMRPPEQERMGRRVTGMRMTSSSCTRW